MKFTDGDEYVGSFSNGKREGQGVWKSAKGIFYEGQWKDDKMEGQGVLTNSNGWKVRAIWEKGLKKEVLQIWN